MSDSTKPTLTKEDLAFFIKSQWSSLLAPNWTRDSLIELGKAVFAKTTLDSMDDKRFGQLLPYLTTMAETMAASIMVQIDSVTAPLIEALKGASSQNEKLTKDVEVLTKSLEELKIQKEPTPDLKKPEVAE